MKKQKGITAAEFMKQLSNDLEYQVIQGQANEQHKNFNNQLSEDALILIRALKAAGFKSIDNIDDLRQYSVLETDVVRILIQELPNLKEPNNRDTVVRVLGIAKGLQELVIPFLIKEFFELDPKTPAWEHYQWSIGNTLEILAQDEYFDDYKTIAENKRFGRSREMIVLGIGKMEKTPAAISFLMTLLNDEEIAGYAIIALGKLRAKSATEKIRTFLNHKKPWIKREARKALLEIENNGNY